MNYQKIPQEPFLFLRQDPQTPPAADSPSDDVFLNTFLQSSQRTSKLINCFILRLSGSDYLNVMFTELLRGKMERYKIINNNLFVLLLSYLKKSHKGIMILFLNEMYNQLVHCLRLKEIFSSCYYLEYKDYLNVMFTE